MKQKRRWFGYISRSSGNLSENNSASTVKGIEGELDGRRAAKKISAVGRDGLVQLGQLKIGLDGQGLLCSHP